MHIHLTHWGRVTHIWVGKLTTIGANNDASPGRRQAIIWTNVGILLIGPFNPNILIQEKTFESVFCEMMVILSRSRCVKLLWFSL